jgi:hypothetical protein
LGIYTERLSGGLKELAADAENDTVALRFVGEGRRRRRRRREN